MTTAPTSNKREAEEAERKKLNQDAAVAAAGLIPAPAALTPLTSSTELPEDAYPGFLASYNGASSGEVLLILHPDVTTALTQAADELRLADAVQPALEAAAKTTGPCVLGPVQEVKLDEVNARRAYDLIALDADGTVTAWIGVLPRSAETSSPPKSAGEVSRQVMNGLSLLRDVEMTLSVEIGRARMTVSELLSLAPGTVVELDRSAGAPADLLVNGRLIARGEVVVVDEDFGLRITEIVQPGSDAS